jgi:hypothetical protein
MIMGASVSTVYYNLKLKHPTLDMPVIDYDLAVLIQPMLMLGISIGVIFNVIFPDWLVTVLLIILFLGTSTKAFLKGIETWKKETIIQREAAKRLEQTAGEEVEYAPLPTGPSAAGGTKAPPSDEAVNHIHTMLHSFVTTHKDFKLKNWQYFRHQSCRTSSGRSSVFFHLCGWHSLFFRSQRITLLLAPHGTGS